MTTQKPFLQVVTADFQAKASGGASRAGYILLDDGSKDGLEIGVEAISKVLPPLLAADDAARTDFMVSVAFDEPFQTEGGRKLERAIYGIAKTPQFHATVQNIVHSCTVMVPGGPIFDATRITSRLGADEWQKMQAAYNNQCGLNSLVDERIEAQRRGAKPEDGFNP
ncbi:MAG: hypothetical protein WC989_09080 [Micavibrio sp.]